MLCDLDSTFDAQHGPFLTGPQRSEVSLLLKWFDIDHQCVQCLGVKVTGNQAVMREVISGLGSFFEARVDDIVAVEEEKWRHEGKLKLLPHDKTLGELDLVSGDYILLQVNLCKVVWC